MKKLNLLFFIFLMIFSYRISYSSDKDTLNLKKDSIKLFDPLKFHGSFAAFKTQSYNNINKKDLLDNPYYELSEAIVENSNVHYLSLSSAGLNNNLSFFGASANSNNWSFNNRSLNNPIFGNYNPSQYPVEFAENFEILNGMQAVVLSENSIGSMINIQEINYNTAKPYTRLWLAQGADEFLGVDAIFSQNFRPNWNFMFAFRNISADGEYERQEFSTWNIRTQIRWNISELSSVSLSENFTNQKNHLSGGYRAASESTIFESLDAFPIFSNTSEREYRHDLNLTFSSYFEKKKKNFISANVYFTNSLHELNRDHNLNLSADDTLSFTDYKYNILGANINFEHNLDSTYFIHTGVNSEYLDLPQTLYSDEWSGVNFASHAMLTRLIDKKYSVSGGLRYSKQFEKNKLSYGTALTWFMDKNSHLKVDLSISNNSPTLIDGINLDNEKHFLAFTELKYGNSNHSITIAPFFRNIKNEFIYNIVENNSVNVSTIASNNQEDRTIFGANLDFKITVLDSIQILKYYDYGKLVFESKSRLNITQKDSYAYNTYPLLESAFKIYYHARAGRSTMNLGFNFEIMTDKNAFYYFPLTRRYIPTKVSSGFMTNGLDIFAELKLGPAFLRLRMENILSSVLGEGYYKVYPYPMYNTHFRFMLSWAFDD